MGKPLLTSKTVWVNLIMAIAAFFPTVQAFITPEIQGGIAFVVNLILRWAFTKEPVTGVV